MDLHDHSVIMRAAPFILAISVALPGLAQDSSTPEPRDPAQSPVWWWGLSGAANLNTYSGTTQQLNGSLITAAPFHKGSGLGPYLAPRLEYRPDAAWGGLLEIAYDDRRGAFNDATCPCGTLSLKARPAYLSIEPSLVFSPFGGNLHFFAGPRAAWLWSPSFLNGREKEFDFNRDGVNGVSDTAITDNFSALRGMVFSGQIGAGYDFRWTLRRDRTMAKLTPFVSWHPVFGQDPRDTDRDIERWGLSTVRLGAALTFAGLRAAPVPAAPDVRFSVRAPATIVARRRIRETFPLRNYVYFGGDSLEFSGRYTRLDPGPSGSAAAFREEHLQDSFPAAPTGRSLRQLAVYHHILNVIGDRLRRNPGATITLSGLSARQGPRYGTARAEEVKRYLMRAFGIEGARITVGEREEPPPPLGRSEAELEMLRAENQRVEILSSSRELLLQVGEDERFMLKPVEIEGEAPGTDSVVFHAAPSRRALPLPAFRAPRAGSAPAPFVWSLAITDDTGGTRRFGPFTRARETLPAALLLGTRARARFTAVMTGREGEASAGVTRQAAFSLSQRNGGVHEILRFGILFDIDQARAVSSYDRFLTEVVAPRVSDTSTVFVRGRTDVIAESAYNLKLSKGRAEGVLRKLDDATGAAGRRGVRFQPSWSGEDPRQAPFGNATPEERNYNRTVIIDIVPEE
jgi:outer membrane protein OmpA-like peptidoglycan-associated protein